MTALQKYVIRHLLTPFSSPPCPPRLPFLSAQAIFGGLRDTKGQRALYGLLIALSPQLKSLILNAALAEIKNEPTKAQKLHVENLDAVEKAHRRRDKEQRSQTKQWRKKGGWD